MEDILLAICTVKYVKKTPTAGIWSEFGDVEWPCKNDALSGTVHRRSFRRVPLALRARTWMIEKRSEQSRVNVPRSCISATSVLVGSRSMQCSRGGAFKCCPEEGSELDHESRDTTIRVASYDCHVQ